MPPNILVILCDDLGWRDLSCQGSTFYETPHLDRLAAEGIRFTDAYAACPVCSPTRASLLSGRYPATVGVTQYIGGHTVGALCDVPYFSCLPRSEYTLASALRDGGDYQTWHVGKWHLGGWGSSPTDHGFDVNVGGCEWGQPQRGYFAPWGIPTLTEGIAGEYLTDRLNDEAIRLIEGRERNRPFFLNYWPYAVHTPIQAPADLVEKYRMKATRLGLDRIEPLEAGEEMPTLQHHGARIQRRRVQSDPVYAAMIENLDANLGRLLECLDREGLRENTLLVFTSDNGGLSTREGSPTCNAPLNEGKGWMYEGGTREPLILRLPGVIPPGVVTDAVTTTPDLYPTVLEIAGIPGDHRQVLDGRSILPALRGEPFDRGPVFWHYPHYGNQGGRPGCSVRDGEWKLIEFFEDERLELYNLRDDVSECRDLASVQPERTRALHARLVAWRERVGALIPKPNPHWPPAP